MGPTRETEALSYVWIRKRLKMWYGSRDGSRDGQRHICMPQGWLDWAKFVDARWCPCIVPPSQVKGSRQIRHVMATFATCIVSQQEEEKKRGPATKHASGMVMGKQRQHDTTRAGCRGPMFRKREFGDSRRHGHSHGKPTPRRRWIASRSCLMPM